jgi:hypothetical protein
MTAPDREDVADWVGLPVADAAGEPVGTCRAVYADDVTGQPDWIGVSCPGLPDALAPIAGAARAGASIRLAVARDAVETSPVHAAAPDLSEEDGARLRRHYGLALVEARSSSLLAGPGAGDSGRARPGWRRAVLRTGVVGGAAALLAAVGWWLRDRLARSVRSAWRRTLGARRRRSRTVGVVPLLAAAGTVAAGGAGRVARVAGRGVQVVARTAGTAAADRASRTRTYWRTTMNKLLAAVGFAAGYLLGAKTGRQRYEQLRRQASDLVQRPEVQDSSRRLAQAAKDKLATRGRRTTVPAGTPPPAPPAMTVTPAPEAGSSR